MLNSITLYAAIERTAERVFSKITLQQLLDRDKQPFIKASHITMGRLSAAPRGKKPLDETFLKLKDTAEILQYLTPLPAHRIHILHLQVTDLRRSRIQNRLQGRKQGQRRGETVRMWLPQVLQEGLLSARAVLLVQPLRPWRQLSFGADDYWVFNNFFGTNNFVERSAVSKPPGDLRGVLPCGTASLAHERPLPEALRAQGAQNPPPLLQVVKQQKLTLQAPPRLHDLETAALGKQHKLLAPHLGGDSREELQTGTVEQQADIEYG